MYNKAKSSLKAALLLSVLFSMTACGGGGGGGGGSSSSGSSSGGSSGGGAPAGPVTDNDNPPLNAQLAGDVITITFSTPGFNPISYAYVDGLGTTTDTTSGDTITATYNSLGATRFDISKSVTMGVGPYYDYVLNVTFSDGLNATFTGTYDADGYDNSNALVPVSGTVTIVE